MEFSYSQIVQGKRLSSSSSEEEHAPSQEVQAVTSRKRKLEAVSGSSRNPGKRTSIHSSEEEKVGSQDQEVQAITSRKRKITRTERGTPRDQRQSWKKSVKKETAEVIVISSTSDSDAVSPLKTSSSTRPQGRNVSVKRECNIKSEQYESTSSPSSNNRTTSESSDSSSASSVTRFFENDENLPVYEWGLTKGKTLQETANILLKKTTNENVAKAVPINVNKNVVFVIDTSAVDHIDDLKADELGTWLCNGVKSAYFKEKTVKVKKVSEKKQNREGVFKLTRRYYTNEDLPTLKRMITTAVNHKQENHRYALVQYIFTKGEQTVSRKPHGNSKQNKRPYKRTMKSTMEKMKSELQKSDPRKVIHSLIDDRGGIDQIRSSGELPRDRKQVYNAVQSLNKSEHIEDALQFLMEKCKEEMTDENTAFIRSVQITPEPIVFMASKRQLVDIERFCCNPASFCVLGVDATFELCNYYLTFATYRNLILETKTGSSPVFVGPAILHKTKLERSYYTLPSEMVRCHPPCAGVLVVGTDGETNLANPLLNVFNSAMHLRCDMHMKDNIKSKLSSLSVPSVVAREYMHDIFGRGEEAGLVHCEAGNDFDEALEKLKTVWEARHPKGKEFYSYFVKNKASDVRETMTAGVRSMCGLGFPPDVYTQNASECMNKVVKEEDKDDNSSRRKKKTVCDIVERIRKLVERQEQEQFLAVLGKGEYKIVDDFKHLEVGDNYYRMTLKQKAALKEEFFTCSRTNAQPIQSAVESENREVELGQSVLSVTPENSQIITVPYSTLKELFNEAGFLIKCQNGLVKSPSTTSEASDPKKIDLWIVAGKDKPHSVKVANTGRVTCDERCVRWARHNICGHTIAVAEKNGMLPRYLQWFRNRRKTGTITKMAEVGTPKASGQKNKATQRRKGRSNISVTATQTRLPQQSRIPVEDDSKDQPRILDNQLCAEQAATATPMASAFLTTNVAPSSSFSAALTTNPTPTSAFPLSLPLIDVDSSCSVAMTHVPTLKPDPPPGLLEVTLLHLCDPRVSVCHGCSQPIRSAGVFIPPPADLVVVTKMRREYRDSVVGEKRQGKLA